MFILREKQVNELVSTLCCPFFLNGLLTFITGLMRRKAKTVMDRGRR
jgi:hypothetical protein